jgi:hypothetical protein
MGFLTRLLHRPGAADPLPDEALGRAAARVEPRLVHTPHWPGRYRAPLAAALAQARRVAQAVPGPVTLDRAHWVRDPLVHSLFASVEDMERCLAQDPVLADFVHAQGLTTGFALLSMRRRERQTFGLELGGEVLRRDVPQQLVWFSEHRFLAPAGEEAAARAQLTWALFDRFLERVAVGVERLRAEQERLRQEKDLAQARLRQASPVQRPGLQAALQDILTDLGEVAQHLDLAHLHEVFATVLSHPEDCLYLEEHAYALDAMGVVRRDGPPEASLHFVDLMERDQPPRTVVMARFTAVTPETPAQRLGEAARWL